jgi:geranylgeranyl pyrophosphate synthase
MENLLTQIQDFIQKYGKNGYYAAKTMLLTDKNLSPQIKEILRYFINESWPNMQHPALISFACETVGGNPKATEEVSAALVLLTGAADIHDDIIDKSKTKAGKPTAYAKFGLDSVLLAGDILLLKALTHLNKATESFSPITRRRILNLVEESFTEIGCATARERAFKGDFSLHPAQCREIIFAKGAVSDAFARIGATIGNGKTSEINSLGVFGRTLSVLMSMRNEFSDMLDPVELKNRIKNETLPLPLLYALQDESVRKELLTLLKNSITIEKTSRIVELALGTEEVRKLKEEMCETAQKEEIRLKSKNWDVAPLTLLLKLSVSSF